MTWLLYMKNNLPSEKQTLSRFARQLIVIKRPWMRYYFLSKVVKNYSILFSLLRTAFRRAAGHTLEYLFIT